MVICGLVVGAGTISIGMDEKMQKETSIADLEALSDKDVSDNNHFNFGG